MFFSSVKKLSLKLVLIVLFSLGPFGGQAFAKDLQSNPQLKSIKAQLSPFYKSPSLVDEIDIVIADLPEDTDVSIRIELDLWKLRALADISDTPRTTAFAEYIYETYSPEDYYSEVQYGDTMQQVVQALSKTQGIDLSFEIVQNLRVNVYNQPSAYLSFIIDKCLMEIYIETFDYSRALDIELSMLENPQYAGMKAFEDWKVSLYNEIAFLYNRLKNGEKALEFLEKARTEYESKEHHPADLIKFKALNNGNRGRAYLLVGNYEAAEEMGRKVVNAGQSLEQNYVVALGYRLIGSAAYNLGDYERAKEALEEGISLSDTHNIATMKKYLYADYAKCLEALGYYKRALHWSKRQTQLEIEAQKSAAATRSSLHEAEDRARISYQEVIRLRRQNEAQREIWDRDARIAKLFVWLTFSLLFIATALAFMFFSLRKGQRKIIESEKQAQIANSAKSEFLANMSHEIRTPMNGVLGMLEVLRRTNLDEKQLYYTDIIHRSGRNLMNIISDILDFSKIEAGKLTISETPCELSDVIQDVVNLFSASAREKQLDLNCRIEKSLPDQYVADVNRIRQILSNLVGNAIKFTPKGRVMIDVSGEIKGDIVQVEIQVRDTGIGIAKEKASLIFEEFTQAEGSTTRDFGGTGLGLTISRRLAEAMNGELSVESTLGIGTTFTLKLPLKIAGATEDEKPTSTQKVIPISEYKEASQEKSPSPPATLSTTPKQAMPPKVKTLEFLVAEDDDVNKLVIENHLKHPRIRLTFVRNGLDALKACKAKTFDLVFMDVAMPVMDGVIATQRIRDYETQQGSSRTPIICLSAHAMIEDRDRFLAAGMDDYLSKPIDKNALLNAIAKRLKPSKAGHSEKEADQNLPTQVIKTQRRKNG